MTTLLLAEDHTIVRDGLKALLLAQKQFVLLGEAADGLTAVEMVARCNPDILLLDLMIPRLHGLEVARRVRLEHSATRVIILSMHSDEPYVVQALHAGASGYVLKDCTTQDLVEAIHTVAAGKRYLSPVLAERALEAFFQSPSKPGLDLYDTLTERERLILQLGAEGLNNSEIGARLFISPRTSETHRANLMRKLGLHSQTDLVRYAIRKRIIPP
jgi:DNA-binding NarL/FixJ family response regulator